LEAVCQVAELFLFFCFSLFNHFSPNNRACHGKTVCPGNAILRLYISPALPGGLFCFDVKYSVGHSNSLLLHFMNISHD
jgi:hypothetical protein